MHGWATRVGVGLVLVLQAASIQPPPSPDAIATRIVREGADVTLQALYRDERTWEAVLKGVASGTPTWLTVATKLRPVADAGAGEQLELAVGEALEHQPANVLRLAVPAFGLEAVCDGPDIDDPRYDSFELAMRAVKLRQDRLMRVTAADLVPLSVQCIRVLETSKAGIARFYGVTAEEPRQEAAAAQTPEAVFDLEPGLTPPEITHRVPVIIPADLKGKGVEQRTTIIEAVIDTAGAVRNARVIRSSYPSFDQASLDAVRQWKYRPAMKDGRPVALRVVITVSPEVR